MPLSARTPVLVGAAQVSQREADPMRAREPLALMEEAARRAAEDAGCPGLLAKADAVRVVRGVWGYGDPGRALAHRFGASGAKTAITPFGGNYVQTTLHRTALDVLAGRVDVAVLVGAECGYTLARARKAGVKPTWSDAPGKPDLRIGEEQPMSHPAELARGIRRPVTMYPIFETALRHAGGESIAAHLERISRLWSGMSDVAAKNPHAWIREPKSAQEIRTPSPANRMVSFPYTKLMTSNSSVDQGAALVLTSVEAARRLGVPEDRFVFPWAGADAHDHLFVSERPDLVSSPAIRIAGARALALAGAGTDELAHVDVYSCFPSAVQVAAKELGLSLARPLTVTGGLTFSGGPLNDYVLHAVACMVELLRADRGAKGLVTANGGFLTKHAITVYSAEPPERVFRHADVQPEVDVLPRREAVVDHQGDATLESYTVEYDATGPALAYAACLTPEGRRTWATSKDRALAEAMTREEHCGRRARLAGGTFVVGA